MTDVPMAVAQNLRSHRAARGWSLDTLAARSGVSKGVLVALERGNGNPNLGTLIRVAESLGLPITALVESGDAPAVRVVPAERQLTLWTGSAGGTGTLLASTDPPHAIELWRWDLRPGEVRESSAHATGSREVINVESGVLRITVDDDVHTVPAGSSATMPGDRRHSYAAEGSQATRFVLAALVPPAP